MNCFTFLDIEMNNTSANKYLNISLEVTTKLFPCEAGKPSNIDYYNLRVEHQAVEMKGSRYIFVQESLTVAGIDIPDNMHNNALSSLHILSIHRNRWV